MPAGLGGKSDATHRNQLVADPTGEAAEAYVTACVVVFGRCHNGAATAGFVLTCRGAAAGAVAGVAAMVQPAVHTAGEGDCSVPTAVPQS